MGWSGPAVATPLLQQARDTVWPKMLESQGAPLAPRVVIDAIEAALKKGKFFVYPTRDAKIGVFMRRLFLCQPPVLPAGIGFLESHNPYLL